MPRKKPCWQAPRNEADIKQLRRQIEDALDKQIDVEFRPLEAEFVARQPNVDHEAALSFLNSYHSYEGQKGRALKAARQGKIEPLRELMRACGVDPDFIPFVQLNSPGGRGDHYEREEFVLPPTDLGTQLERLAALDDPEKIQKFDARLRLQAAVADARRIRDFREKDLDGKRNGPIARDLTAEGIAADRWYLSAEEVRKKQLAVGRR